MKNIEEKPTAEKCDCAACKIEDAAKDLLHMLMMHNDDSETVELMEAEIEKGAAPVVIVAPGRGVVVRFEHPAKFDHDIDDPQVTNIFIAEHKTEGEGRHLLN